MGELYQRSEIEHTKRNSVQYNYLIDQNLGDVGHCYNVLVYNAALEGGGGGKCEVWLSTNILSLYSKLSICSKDEIQDSKSQFVLKYRYF